MKTINIGSKQYEVNTDADLGHPLIYMDLNERISLYCQYLNVVDPHHEEKDEDLNITWKSFIGNFANYHDDEWLYGLKRKVTNGVVSFSPNGVSGFTSLPFETHVAMQMIHSCLGEHNKLIKFGLEHSIEEMLKAYEEEKFIAVRTDLFQSYWSKGTKVREWVSNELVPVWIPQAINMLKSYEGSQPIMKAKMDFYEWTKTSPLSTQHRLKYAIQDVFLDIAVARPDILQPESFIEPGTGCRRGFAMMFDEKCKGTEAQFTAAIDKIVAHSEYNTDLRLMHYATNEAALCYFHKSIQGKTFGIKRKLK